MDEETMRDLINWACSQLSREEWIYWAGYLLDNCELEPETRRALAATRDSLNCGLLELRPTNMAVH